MSGDTQASITESLIKSWQEEIVKLGHDELIKRPEYERFELHFGNTQVVYYLRNPYNKQRHFMFAHILCVRNKSNL